MTKANKLSVSADDKIIISDMLFFIQNQMHSLPNDESVSFCCYFYTDECIWHEKEHFFTAVGKRPVKSRTVQTEDKKFKDVNNIFLEMRKESGNPLVW